MRKYWKPFFVSKQISGTEERQRSIRKKKGRKNMKGTMRRAVSIVLALAMVITSLSYTPKTVEAAEDYSGLSFTEVVGMNGSYAWNLKENNIAGFSGTPEFYGQNYMKIVYSADNKTEDTKITVDGVPKTLSDEEVFEQALEIGRASCRERV